MSAVAGQFVKMEPVATRKVVRLHVECPIERADEILRALGGYPDPANAKWVGIAPLNAKPENTLKGGKLAQSAGIICSERAFQQFSDTSDAEEAADWLRQRCGVESRAHLDHDEEAAAQFRDLKTEYENWLRGIAA